MKFSLLLLLVISFKFCISQDNSWQKFRVDSNLTIEFPGLPKRQPSMKIDRYSYDLYSYETDRFMFMVMVGTSEQEIEVHNQEDYEEALSDMAEGARKAGSENDWTITITDVMIDSVPGKKMSYSGKIAKVDAMGNNYLFLVNGLSYSVNTMLRGQDLSAGDSLELNHYISSIDFTDKIREQQFETRTENIAYAVGKIIGGVIILGIIMLIVILIIRRF